MEIKAHECLKFQCDGAGCSEGFDKFNDYKSHMKEAHAGGDFFCFECAIPFVTQVNNIN